MVCRCSLRRVFYLCLILFCALFLTHVSRLPEIIDRQSIKKARLVRPAGVSESTRTQVTNLVSIGGTRSSRNLRETPTCRCAAKNTKLIRTNGLQVSLTTERKISVPEIENKFAWFLKNGTKYPTYPPRRRVWPQEDPGSDRIVQQLMYIPRGYNETRSPIKTILMWHGLDRWIKPGQRSFLEAKCPVNRCAVTDDHSLSPKVDAILFKDHFVLPHFQRPSSQVWIIYLLECPYHTERFQYNDLINWTATYRRDSDIVTPYEKWVYYDEKVKGSTTMRRNYAANKTHHVAWFVSNCNARNGRLHYALELRKYIPVDIYGFCGPLKCPRTQECFHLLETKYKFYLAFENSNCVDYITEKFFVNGLQHDILPIVMGARPQDYEAVAPHQSYIHVDNFASPKELAQYLHRLNDDDDLYNMYFRWKETGEFINTQFFCRLCAMLHDPHSSKTYRNLNKWWKNVDTCINSGRWHTDTQP